jgi:hypothetical protein
LYASLIDGRVMPFDILTPDGLRGWETLASGPDGGALTGVALGTGGARADLPLPRRFRGVRFSAEVLRDRAGEPAAERVSALSDGVLLSLTMFLNGRSGRFRVDLDKRGRARWTPPS